MKTLKTIIILISACFIFYNASAQTDKNQRTIGIKKESIRVLGNCSMDKRRIETAAKSVAGVKSAVWIENTQILNLQYSAFKSEAADQVQHKIASVGNDTEKYRADDAVYQALPDCCHYKRK